MIDRNMIETETWEPLPLHANYKMDSFINFIKNFPTDT